MLDDGPVFKKDHLQLYQVLSKPGTYIVKVANTVRPHYLIEDGSKSRYIVNLRVATKDNLLECLKVLGVNEAIPFDQVKQFFTSGTIWYNQLDDIEYLPTKGEAVIATFNDKLQCESITLIPRKELTNFDLDAYNVVKNMYKNLLDKL
jgi:hypothetical protein